MTHKQLSLLDSTALLTALQAISVTPTTPIQALSQLEFAAGMIKHSDVDPAVAPQIKIGFAAKLVEIGTVNAQYANVSTSPWAKTIYAKLDKDAGAFTTTQTAETGRAEELPVGGFKADEPALAAHALGSKTNGAGAHVET